MQNGSSPSRWPTRFSRPPVIVSAPVSTRVTRHGGTRLLPVIFDPVALQVDGHVRAVEDVIGEIFLDQIALVAKADDEVVEAVTAVEHHDVPEDRLAADLDHRLGPDLGFLGKAGAEAAGQQDDFHDPPRRRD